MRAIVVLLLSWLLHVAPVSAALTTSIEHYVCDGDPLTAQLQGGAVDAIGIPNSTGGTVPGAYVVLQWRGVSLQLPRTNNAGPPSFTDGRWLWQAGDPEHPTFAQRRGNITRYNCDRPGA